MTVCIGAICQRSNIIVYAADRMITSGYLSKEFEHDVPKIFKLSTNVVSLVAGSATAATELHRKVEFKLKNDGITQIEDVVNILTKEYSDSRNEKVGDRFFRPRGLTREQFYNELSSKVPQDLALFLDKAVQTFDLGIELIVAGVDNTGAHIYVVTNPGENECMDAISFHSIGSGSPHALVSLIGNNVSPNNDLLHCLYNVYEAKKRSESSPGVGKLTDIGIITKEGIFDLKQAEISKLDKSFRDIDEPRKDMIEKSLKGLNEILIKRGKA